MTDSVDIQLASWRDPRIERRDGGLHGIGLFALEDIPAGELIAIKAGKIIDHAFVTAHPEIVRGTHMQLTDDLFIGPTNIDEWDRTLIGCNHSCDPNIYIEGDIRAVTLRPIVAGEEIVCDFSTALSTSTHIIDKCLCKSSQCRGKVDPPNDWKDPAFQKRYKGYFSSYLQKKIDKQA
jgi:uncharacterized protein